MRASYEHIGILVVTILLLLGLAAMSVSATLYDDECWRLSHGTPCINWTGVAYVWTGVTAPETDPVWTAAAAGFGVCAPGYYSTWGGASFTCSPDQNNYTTSISYSNSTYLLTLTMVDGSTLTTTISNGNTTAQMQAAVNGSGINITGNASSATNADQLNSQTSTYYTNASNVASGVLSVSYGGTGGNSTTNARNNLSVAANGTCAAGQAIQNATTTSVQCVTLPTWTDTGTVLYTSRIVQLNGSASPEIDFNESGDSKVFKLIEGSAVWNVKTPSGVNVIQVIDNGAVFQTQNSIINPSYNDKVAIQTKTLTGMTVPVYQVQNSTSTTQYAVNVNNAGGVNFTMVSANGTVGTCYMNNTKSFVCV